MAKDEETNKLAWKIYESLAAAGAVIGNASAPSIMREIINFTDALLERAASVADQYDVPCPPRTDEEQMAHNIAANIRRLKLADPSTVGS